MKKTYQLDMNAHIVAHYDTFMGVLSSTHTTLTAPRPLRSCSAVVFDIVSNDTGEILYHVLKSYNTIVAFIDVETDTLYDVLRYVYGYTATSASHIAKFSKDYGRGNWGCADRQTWKAV